MTRTALLLALILPALAPQDALRCAPEAGLVLRKRFEREGRLELLSMDMTVDGASHGGMQKPELSLEFSGKSVLLDRYEKVEEGRVTRLVRTFEELSEERSERVSEPEGAEERSSSAKSDLEGQSVVFTWDGDEQAYSAAFEDEKGDSDLLAGLEAELDLGAYLPSDQVSEGDTWEVPASAFATLLRPGGDLKLVSDQGQVAGPDAQLAENLDGTIRATLRSGREEGDLSLAVIGLELELSASAEHGLEDGSGEERQSNTYELSGELCWVPAAGRFHSIELTGSLRSAIVTRRSIQMGGQEFQTERTLELGGEVSYRLRAEVP